MSNTFKKHQLVVFLTFPNFPNKKKANLGGYRDWRQRPYEKVDVKGTRLETI